MMPINLDAVEWRHMSEDGLGPVEITLTVNNRHTLGQLQNLVRGIHYRWSDESTMQITQPVILRIKDRRSL